MTAAVEMWERGVNHYVDGGFHNNAIALCNKILRNAPARTPVYLKLAQLMVERGFVAEAKQHLLEYAERMKKAGQLDQAFKALKEFADLSPNSEEIRLLLAEQLKAAARTDEAREQLAKLYAETQAAGDERRARATMEKLKAIDPDYDVESAPKAKVATKPGKSSDLVFIDLDAPAAPAPRASRPAAAAPPPPKAQAAPPPPPPEPEPEPELEAEPEPLAIEPTAIEELAAADEPPVERAEVELDPGRASGQMEGLMGTSFDTPAQEEPAFDVPDIEPAQTDQLEPEVVEDAGMEVPDLDLQTISARPSVGAEGVEALDFGADSLDLGEPLGVEVVGPPDIPTLEGQVAADPDDPQRHQALGEALLEAGQRERGLEELDIALGRYEALEDWLQAEDLADEILRLDPNSVRHHQKRVEYAFRRNDKGHLIEAYLGLADALFRSGAIDRARAVYQRVIEHDAQNERAGAAIASIEPAEPATKEARPAAAAAGSGDFVDLGALIMEPEPTVKGDARLRIQDEEPTGDEQRDFDNMLAKFKEGIDATLGADDSQAHYDLGIAFKEMGLLDEAIGEFQKALRGQEHKLRTSEALGTCFFEKGQHNVAATVLRRAIESDSGGDESKIGLLYWLGRSEEELERQAEALALYQRVIAVDIRFQDVRDRVQSLAKAGR